MGNSTAVVPVTRQESEARSPLWGLLSLGSLCKQEEMLSMVLGV